MSDEYEIVICPPCKGEGQIFEHVLANYHKSEYDMMLHQCKNCGGSGRVKKHTKITYSRFTPK